MGSRRPAGITTWSDDDLHAQPGLVGLAAELQVAAGDEALRGPGADDGVEHIVGLRAAWPLVLHSTQLGEGAPQRVQALGAALARALVELHRGTGELSEAHFGVHLEEPVLQRGRLQRVDLTDFGEDAEELSRDGPTAGG